MSKSVKQNNNKNMEGGVNMNKELQGVNEMNDLLTNDILEAMNTNNANDTLILGGKTYVRKSKEELTESLNLSVNARVEAIAQIQKSLSELSIGSAVTVDGLEGVVSSVQGQNDSIATILIKGTNARVYLNRITGNCYKTIGEAVNGKTIDEMKLDNDLGFNYKYNVLRKDFTPDSLFEAFMFQRRGDGVSPSIVDKVGTITLKGATVNYAYVSGHFEDLIAMYSEMADSCDKERHVIKGSKYESVLDREMNFKVGEKAIARVGIAKEKLGKIKSQLCSIDLNNVRNLINISKDLDAVLRLYQETVIDAAKTGEIIELDLLTRTFKDKTQLKFEGKIVTVEGKMTAVVERHKEQAGQNYKDSILSKAQDKVVQIVTKKANEDLQSPVLYDQEMAELCRQMLTTGTTNKLHLINKAVTCMYYPGMNALMGETNRLNDDEIETEQSMEAVEDDKTAKREQFNKNMELTAEYVRRHTSNLSYKERLAIVTSSLMKGRNQNRPFQDIKTKVCMNLLRQESLINANNGNPVIKPFYLFNDNKKACEIYATHTDEDQIIISNGQDIVSKLSLDCKTDKPYTGLATVEIVERNNRKIAKAVVKYEITMPTYNSNEVLFFIQQENKEIIIPNKALVEIEKFDGKDYIIRNKKGRKISKPLVKFNGGEFNYEGLLDFKEEKHLSGFVGNVVDYVMTEMVSKKDGKTIIYSALVKAKMDMTKQEAEAPVLQSVMQDSLVDLPEELIEETNAELEYYAQSYIADYNNIQLASEIFSEEVLKRAEQQAKDFYSVGITVENIEETKEEEIEDQSVEISIDDTDISEDEIFAAMNNSDFELSSEDFNAYGEESIY